MASITAEQIERLLNPISEQEPCGPDGTGSEAMLKLDRHAQEQVLAAQTQARNNPDDPPPWPDWSGMPDLALAALDHSKHVEAFSYLLSACARHDEDALQSFAALADVLARWHMDYWETLHPQRDPNDESDMFDERRFALEELSTDPSELQDTFRIVAALRFLPLMEHSLHGPITRHRLMLARGQLANAQVDGGAITSEALQQLGLEADAAFLDQLEAHAQAAQASFEAVQDRFQTKVGRGNEPDLKLLIQELAALADEARALRMNRANEDTAQTAEDSDTTLGSPVQAGGGTEPRTGVGVIESREQVVQALNRICEYYRRCEPGSPIPLLLARPRRLVYSNFLQIIQEVAPGGIGDFRTASGVTEEEESNQ